MSATEVLRRLLDERGVEYDTDDEDGCEFTEWVANGLEWEADSRGELVYLTPAMLITPEQAIAATLGDVPRLPHFWTHDGTLHAELPKLPESISVRLPGQRDREVGSARVWQYTRSSGTCREVYLLMATDIGDGREEVLGVYATEEAAMAAINENQFGYALHHVRKWEVDA